MCKGHDISSDAIVNDAIVNDRGRWHRSRLDMIHTTTIGDDGDVFVGVGSAILIIGSNTVTSFHIFQLKLQFLITTYTEYSTKQQHS